MRESARALRKAWADGLGSLSHGRYCLSICLIERISAASRSRTDGKRMRATSVSLAAVLLRQVMRGG